MIKLIFVIFHPSYYNQVEPAISKQVEFLNGYMHADDAWHVFTNNIGGGKLILSRPSRYLSMVFKCPHGEFSGDDAWFTLRHLKKHPYITVSTGNG